MSESGKASDVFDQRLRMQRDLCDPDATSFLAITTTGSTYSARLLSSESALCFVSGLAYQVRDATAVVINDEPFPEAVTIGYCIDVGTIVVLDAQGVAVSRSSTLTSLAVS